MPAGRSDDRKSQVPPPAAVAGPGRTGGSPARDGAQEDRRRALEVDAAFRKGDLDGLGRALGDPAIVPNGPMPPGFGPCLEYAIYHSPLAFIRTLLEIGAEPNPTDHGGFPPLIAALSCSRSGGGAQARPDVVEIIELLLDFGADPNQRGVNDYTALHMAAAEGHLDAARRLLARGADPSLRTRIDDHETPREVALASGHVARARVLAAAEEGVG